MQQDFFPPKFLRDKLMVLTGTDCDVEVSKRHNYWLLGLSQQSLSKLKQSDKNLNIGESSCKDSNNEP